jgi:hypothetical protein
VQASGLGNKQEVIAHSVMQAQACFFSTCLKLRNAYLNLLLLLVLFFSMAPPARSGPRPLIQFRNHFYTDGMTPWTSDQPVARPLPKHRTSQTQNKRIHTPNIHILSGIRTHNPSVRASEDSSCLTPRGYCDQPSLVLSNWNNEKFVRAWIIQYGGLGCGLDDRSSDPGLGMDFSSPLHSDQLWGHLTA